MKTGKYIYGNHRVGYVFFLWLVLIANGFADPYSRPDTVPIFKKSDIFIMYNSKDEVKLREYNVDNISWGSQVHIYPEEIKKNKAVLRDNAEYGIKLSSVNIALIQEGGKYVVCGDKWNFKCDKSY